MNESVEVEIVVRDSKNNEARRHFEFRALGPDVDAAASELRRGFIGSIDQRITEVSDQT